MQKYLAILEDKVQWIAIALGALFVLFMTYTYVLKPPAEVTVGGETLGPGEIDDYTVQKVVSDFQSKLESNEAVKLEVPKHVQRFKDQMSWKEAAPAADFAVVYGAQAKDVEIPKAPAPPGPDGKVPPPVPNGPVVAGVKVNNLPVIPAPTPGDHAFGRSLVIPPDAPGVAPAPAPAPGQAPANAHDQDWVTQVYKVNIADIDKAFTDAKIPANDLRKTLFLQVVLEREELDANGKPIAGTLKTIDPIPGVSRNPAAVVPPFPAAGDMAAAVNYLQYAAQNQPDIIEPIFFSTVPTTGDQWQKPGKQQQLQQVFDPATFTGSIDSLQDPAQKDAVSKYRRDKYKADLDAKKAAHPAPAPRTGGRAPTGMEGEGGGPARSYAPAPVAPRTPPPARPPVGYPPVRPGTPPFRGNVLEGDSMEGGGAYNQGNAVQIQGLPTAGTDYPSADFDPGAPEWKTKTIEIWAHDTTVESGKTYHYRIKYKLKNPLFGTNAGATPELNSTFALVSAEGGPWGSPRSIPQLVNPFVASSKAPGSNTVRFDIFKWDKGKNVKETFSVGPGDPVGSVKNGVDYSTDWTVVDFRADERQHGQTQILLVNNKDGKVSIRSYEADSNDALYKGLKEQLKLNAPLPGAAPQAGAPTGTVAP